MSASAEDRNPRDVLIDALDSWIRPDAAADVALSALSAAGWAVVPEAELATLRAELAAAREALDFYACADHYPIHGAAEPDVVRNDGGRRARAALGDKP